MKNSKYDFDSATKFKEVIMSTLSDRAHNKMMDYKQHTTKDIFTGKEDAKKTD